MISSGNSPRSRSYEAGATAFQQLSVRCASMFASKVASIVFVIDSRRNSVASSGHVQLAGHRGSDQGRLVLGKEVNRTRERGRGDLTFRSGGSKVVQDPIL